MSSYSLLPSSSTVPIVALKLTPDVLELVSSRRGARGDTLGKITLGQKNSLQIDGANYELRRRPLQSNLTEIVQRESDLDVGADNFRRLAPVSHSFTVRSVLNARAKRRQKEIMEKSMEEKNARKTVLLSSKPSPTTSRHRPAALTRSSVRASTSTNMSQSTSSPHTLRQGDRFNKCPINEKIVHVLALQRTGCLTLSQLRERCGVSSHVPDERLIKVVEKAAQLQLDGRNYMLRSEMYAKINLSWGFFSEAEREAVRGNIANEADRNRKRSAQHARHKQAEAADSEKHQHYLKQQQMQREKMSQINKNRNLMKKKRNAAQKSGAPAPQPPSKSRRKSSTSKASATAKSTSAAPTPKANGVAANANGISTNASRNTTSATSVSSGTSSNRPAASGQRTRAAASANDARRQTRMNGNASGRRKASNVAAPRVPEMQNYTSYDMDGDIDMSTGGVDDKENRPDETSSSSAAASGTSPTPMSSEDLEVYVPPITCEEEYEEYRREYDSVLTLYKQKAEWLRENARVFEELGNRLTECAPSRARERETMKMEIRQLHDERIESQKAQLADVERMDFFLANIKQRVNEYDEAH